MSKLYVDELHPKTSGDFVDINKRVFARMSQKAVALQSIATATWTTVVFDTATDDTHSMCNVSDNKITIPTGLGGLYLMKGCIRHNEFNTLRSILQFSINGTLEGEFSERAAASKTTSRYATNELIVVRELSDGDDIALNFYHDYGSSQNIADGDNSRYMYLLRLGSI